MTYLGNGRCDREMMGLLFHSLSDGAWETKSHLNLLWESLRMTFSAREQGLRSLFAWGNCQKPFCWPPCLCQGQSCLLAGVGMPHPAAARFKLHGLWGLYGMLGIKPGGCMQGSSPPRCALWCRSCLVSSTSGCDSLKEPSCLPPCSLACGTAH